MSDDPTAEANRAQLDASDPQVSAFVSASAGSGKTKLLIDRLLRLMLPRGVGADGTVIAGGDPGRILCLTYTKAAAAEMSNRLQERLGTWVTLRDPELDQELERLRVACHPATRRAARALFARVLDLPGGMRISTIHAFCQSLLRRFPLEAAISPSFKLAEESDDGLALHAAIEAALGARAPFDPAVAALAAEVKSDAFAPLVKALLEKLSATPGALSRLAECEPEPLRAALRTAAGVTHVDADQCRRAGLTGRHEEHLVEMLHVVVEHGTPAARQSAQTRLDWLTHPPEQRAVHWSAWQKSYVTKGGKPLAHGGLKGKWLDAHPRIIPALLAEADRVIEIENQCDTIRTVELSATLLTVALPILKLYAAQKQAGGRLDYQDLITRTLALLDNPRVAWVLYKLDGGIDHLLLDEVQDTSPLQWRIASALTSEFFSGAGAASGPNPGLPRTVFAVGDPKQSIFSFQGADPAQFHLWREEFRRRVEASGREWREPALNVSFRSVEPVLRLVDAVFEGADPPPGLLQPGQSALAAHRSARAGEPGRVELWPLTPVGEKAPLESPTEVPRENSGQDSALQILAQTLARWIARQIGRRTGSAGPDEANPIRAGDILVLVQHRGPFVHALIRALKAEAVPVASLVATEFADQIAVQDLRTLCEALLLPQDDLAVACVLTSPLGGLTDDSLMELASSRGHVHLWDCLRARHPERSDWAGAWLFLSALFERVDFLGPYALLAEALGALGGRARLLARLGPEAAEPVDDLLSAARRFEERNPPSLQGFVHWLVLSHEKIKREPGDAGDAVRVMTVHGAKGLQARLVVLPDTVWTPGVKDKLFWARSPADGGESPAGELPLWVPRADLDCQPAQTIKMRLHDGRLEEQNRLLYVALTRASDRLVVCGWTPGKSIDTQCWYERVRAGFERIAPKRSEFALDWPGEQLVIENTVANQRGSEALRAGAGAGAGLAASPASGLQAMPHWLGHSPAWHGLPPPAEPQSSETLVPSRPEGVEFGPNPAVLSPLAHPESDGPGKAARLARGKLVHSLLQHLPIIAPADRLAAAQSYAARAAFALSRDAASLLAAQVMAVMDDPLLAAMFDADGRAEQPLAGRVEGHVVIGQVDRMRVLPDRVIVCDFKTGRMPPAKAEQTPVAYLRQMAAYRALLAQLYPGRVLDCLLVWTEGPLVTRLPEALLDQHRPGAWPASAA